MLGVRRLDFFSRPPRRSLARPDSAASRSEGTDCARFAPVPGVVRSSLPRCLRRCSSSWAGVRASCRRFGPLDIVFGGIARARCRFSFATIFLFLRAASAAWRAASSASFSLRRSAARWRNISGSTLERSSSTNSCSTGLRRYGSCDTTGSSVAGAASVLAPASTGSCWLQFLQLLSRRLCGQFIRVAL